VRNPLAVTAPPTIAIAAAAWISGTARAATSVVEATSTACSGIGSTYEQNGPVNRANTDHSERSIEPAATRGAELHVSVAGIARGRRARHLAEQIREAVLAGRLVAGGSLPSSRALAEDLGVSRGVVVDVYEQLVAEGYLDTGPGRRGTRVSARTPSVDPTRQLDGLPRRAGTNPGRPDPALFPRREWLRAYTTAVRTLTDGDLSYGEARGLDALRLELSRYLARVRGIGVDPGQIMIVSGFAQGMVCIVRLLTARFGSPLIAVEDPGSIGSVEQLRAWGARVVAIPVDADGIVTDALEGSGAHAVLVTPAHQYPTGVTLAAHRRVALVDWARRTGALVIEDDYDAEYRYDRSALTSLHALMPDRVITGGSTSKSLAPALRIGWLVAPADLVDDLVDIKATLDLATTTLEQAALAHFIANGSLDRHLRRTRAIYRQRRDAVIEAARSLPGVAAVSGIAAGLHVVIRLEADANETAMVDAARSLGLDAQPLTKYCMRTAEPGLVLGFGMSTPGQLQRQFQALSQSELK